MGQPETELRSPISYPVHPLMIPPRRARALWLALPGKAQAGIGGLVAFAIERGVDRYLDQDWHRIVLLGIGGVVMVSIRMMLDRRRVGQ